MENQKIGVYICSGCDIDKAVDIEKLEGVAKNEYKVPVCRTHPFLCSQEGVQLLKDDQKNEGINSFVVAACSTRYHETTFDMGSENILVRAPIREYVAWTLAPRDEEGNVDEDTQMAAEDYVRMYTSKITQHTLPVPYEQETNKSVLVIGAGVTGLTSALEAAKAGYEVNLVEKSDGLGGYALNDKSMIPENPPFNRLVPNNVKDLIAEVEAHGKVSVHTASTVDSIAGEPGAFQVKLKGSDSAEFKAGGIVMATGSVPYDASKLTDLGIGFDNVISSVDFESMAASGSLKKKDGSPAKNIAFIQCAGSRDPNHLSYCSNTCCMRSLKQAAYVREMDSDAKAFIIYRDMITPGQYEDFYRTQQDDPGVFLTKGDVVGVNEAADKGVTLDIDNSLLGDQIQLQADLVVLAVGQVPSVLDGESVLNLEYRQGPELPELKHGYPDSHFICFPYETRRTGIYAAGTVRKPMDYNFAKRDATGAALKAIQAAEMTDLGKRVHPRSGDMTYMDIFFNRCTDCKRCTEECPFGALNENEKGTPLPFPARCRACGTCMGACPERCISFPDFNIQAVGDMIKAIEIPDEYDEKPRVIAFVCENDAGPAFDLLALNRTRLNPYVRYIPVRCLGSFNLVFVSDSLSVGFDGILALGCKHGDDYQCHFVKGSELCNERLGKVQETISRLALESERVQQYEISMNDSELLPKILNDFLEELDAYGPNPFKGM